MHESKRDKETRSGNRYKRKETQSGNRLTHYEATRSNGDRYYFFEQDSTRANICANKSQRER